MARCIKYTITEPKIEVLFWFKKRCNKYIKFSINQSQKHLNAILERFLALVTMMVTKVDHGNHRNNDRSNHRSNHRGYYNGNT